MSHFTVMVVGPKNENELAEAMAPFQENNMGDCPEKYLEFNDVEDEYEKQYNNEKVDMVRSPGGDLFRPWDNRFKVRVPGDPFASNTVIPDGYEKVSVQHKEVYKTFEQFMREWAGHASRDEKTGRYGYWENPNRKWDWYQVGGRWAGMLILKAGSKGVVGSKSFLMDGDPYAENDGSVRADAARHGDIDWELMFRKNAESAGKSWDETMARVAERDVPAEEWDARFAAMDESAAARFKVMCSHSGRAHNVETYRLWCLNEPFGVNLLQYGSREDYVAKHSVPSTFAYLKDGVWCERGDMGWFGIVADEKDCKTWEQEFEAMLEALDPDTMIWIVDCHI